MKKPALLAFVAVGSTFSTAAFAATVPVSNTDELAAALDNAKAGDEIVLASGTYALGDTHCSGAGTTAAPIVVRSAVPLGAKIELSGLQNFRVSGPNWHFEDLDIVGVCTDDTSCEHAFHVTGDASGFVLRRSRIVDFSAQVKVNTVVDGVARTPNAGLVEFNEIYDTHARATDAPITKLNIDTGDDWIVRGNVIRDFHRVGDGPTYGAFMKSGGKNGLFERNLVICTKDETTSGAYIGLSFGGGGTGRSYCAPAFDESTPCEVEHENGVLRNNVIVNCSDVGIHLNRAKNTKVLHNTLIATLGIHFRYGASTGEARGNVLDGDIRMRDGAPDALLVDNLILARTELEELYRAPLVGDLRKKGDLSRLLGKITGAPSVVDDYCARPRGAGPLDLGALQHSLGDCDTTKPPMFGPSSPGSGDASAPPAAPREPGGGAPPSAGTATVTSAEAPPAEPAGGAGCRAAASGGGSAVTALAVAFAASAFARRRRHAKLP